MQWPDASASAERAAGFEAVPSGTETVVVAEPYTGGHARQPATMTGTAALFALTGAPVGLDLPCADDPELFFAEAPADVEAAKTRCHGCRVRTACLQGALERREPWGVWGGELLLRGAIVPRKRPRGRPRKTPGGELTDAVAAKGGEQAA